MDKIINFIIGISALMLSAPAQAQDNTLTKKEKEEGWQLLFDGKTTTLRGYQAERFPSEAWRMEDNALVSISGVPNMDLVTPERYKNFELSMDWKVSKGGNSGVFFHVQENRKAQPGNGNSANWLDYYEMQILDDLNFNDKEPKRSAGSLYDLIAAENKKLKPVGEYNTAKLSVKDAHVEHWLNGTKVVEYNIGGEKLIDLISKSKFSQNTSFGKSTEGHIMFQHHGQQVWLKNIKIKPLDLKAQYDNAYSEDTILLNHIAVYVHDLEKSTTFYTKILKFKKVPEPFKDGKHTWFDLSSTSRLHLIQGSELNINRDKNDHLCFSVPSVENFITRLNENSIPYFNWPGVLKSITVRLDGVKQIYFQDPDGHWIEINDDFNVR